MMRKQVKSALKRELETVLRARLPEFRPVSGPDAPDGYFIYQNAAVSTPAQFIALVAHESRDMFTVEIAWADSGKFPSTVIPAYPSDPVTSSIRYRLPTFWHSGRRDFWWELTAPEPSDLSPEQRVARLLAPEEPVEDVCARIPAAVADAVQRIEQFAIPLFQAQSCSAPSQFATTVLSKPKAS